VVSNETYISPHISALVVSDPTCKRCQFSPPQPQRALAPADRLTRPARQRKPPSRIRLPSAAWPQLSSTNCSACSPSYTW